MSNNFGKTLAKISSYTASAAARDRSRASSASNSGRVSMIVCDRQSGWREGGVEGEDSVSYR